MKHTLIFLAIFTTAIAFADTITLYNGKTIECDVTARTEREFIFMCDGSVSHVAVRKISAINFSHKKPNLSYLRGELREKYSHRLRFNKYLYALGLGSTALGTLILTAPSPDGYTYLFSTMMYMLGGSSLLAPLAINYRCNRDIIKEEFLQGRYGDKKIRIALGVGF